MTLRRTLLVAAVAAAATASPAVAAQPNLPSQNLVVTATATSGVGVYQVHATCVARTDQWTADYGATSLDAVAVTNGASHTSVLCEIWGNDAYRGDISGDAQGPVAVVSGAAGYMNRDIKVCVTATGTFRGTTVTTRNCETGG